MKHLKTYEQNIKFSDPKVINHPLLDFALKLEKIVIGIKNLDNFNNSNVKKYFNDNGKIAIKYRDNADLLKIELYLNNNDVTMSINHATFRTNGVDINSKEFLHFAQNKLKKYSKLKMYNNIELFYFHINKTNTIIKVLEGFFEYIELNIATNKYNI